MDRSQSGNRSEAAQRKTFVRWLNQQIKRSEHSKTVKEVTVDAMEDDLQDGEVLLHLMAATTGVPLPAKWEKMNQGKRTPFRMNVNNDLVFDMAKTAGIKTVGIGSQDITDKQTKLILGLLWTVIYNQQVGNIQGAKGEKTGKEGLRLWVAHSVEDKKQTCGEVKNFTTSWTDGKILAALIAKHAPESLDYDAVIGKGSDLERIEHCIKVAEQLGAAALLDAQDMGVDEKSMVTYVAELHKTFSARMGLDRAQKAVASFLNDQKMIDSCLWDYEEGTQAFCEFAEREIARISGLPPVSKEPGPDDLVPSQKRLEDSHRFSKATLGPKRLAKKQLEGLLTSFQAILSRCGRPAYQPSKELAPERVEKLWEELTELAEKETTAVRAVYRKAREAVLSKYIELSTRLWKELEKIHQELTGLGGDMEAEKKLEAVKLLGEKLAGLKKDLDACIETEGVLTTAKVNLDDVSEVEKSAADIEAEYESLCGAIEREEKLLTAQIAKKAGPSSSSLSEKIEETFKKCAVSQKNSLTNDEFINALIALGYNVEDADKLFAQYAKEGELTLEDFMKIIDELMSQRSGEGPDVLGKALESLCGGELTIEKLTETLGAEDAQYLWSKGGEGDGPAAQRLLSVFSNTVRVGKAPPQRTGLGRRRGVSMRSKATEAPLGWDD